MTVGKIMNTEVVTIHMDDSLVVIKEIFENVKFHHLLVVENKKLIGIISDRDYLKTISPFLDTLSERSFDLATLKKRAHQIMTRKPVCVNRDTSVKEASQLMLEQGVSCLPVISQDRTIEGIITWKDLLKHFIS